MYQKLVSDQLQLMAIVNRKKALNPMWKRSVYHNLSISGAKKLIYVSCLCHRLYNVYKYVTEHNGEIISVINSLYSISTQYNQSKSSILPECPVHCETRLVYDYYITKCTFQLWKTFFCSHLWKMDGIFYT